MRHGRGEPGEELLAVPILLPGPADDLDVLSRPVTYVTMQTRSVDGKDHTVQLYFDATAEWAVNTADQQVKWSREQVEGIDAMRVGTVEQPVLAKAGDNIRIDWGHFYVAVPKDEQAAGKTWRTRASVAAPRIGLSHAHRAARKVPWS